jgi:hypothetical protein
MKKIALVLSLAAVMGLVFSPALMSNSNENVIEYADTTKTKKKVSTKHVKNEKSDCSTSKSSSCCKSSCSKSTDTKKAKTDPKK